MSNAEWFHIENACGVSWDKPGIYMWTIAGVGSYVGRYTRKRRPLREYALNVERLLDGRPYRKSKPNGFRHVHRELAKAARDRTEIILSVIENPPRDQILMRERKLIAKYGNLNRTGRHKP